MRMQGMVGALLAVVAGVGTLADARTAHAEFAWTEYVDGSPSPPAAWVPSNVPTGGNSIIVGWADPCGNNVGKYDFYYLLSSTDSKGDHEVENGFCATDGEHYFEQFQSTSYHYQGLSVSIDQSYNPHVFGWTGLGHLYENNTDEIESGGWSQGLLYNGDVVYSLNANVSSCNSSGYPHGTCIYDLSTGLVLSGSPGAVQIGPEEDDGDEFFAVDSSGVVWQYYQGSWTDLPTSICSTTNTLDAAMAIGYGDTYALSKTSSGGGTVYVYNFLEGCWEGVTTSAPSGGFYSIGPNIQVTGSSEIALWATDENGHIWYITD